MHTDIQIYGIRNCDTMKKAMTWLHEQGINFSFVDYKKQAPDAALLRRWLSQSSWQVLLNSRGTTWRKLSEQERQNIDTEKAVALMQQYPSLIRRPVLEQKEKLLFVGFDPAQWHQQL